MELYDAQKQYPLFSETKSPISGRLYSTERGEVRRYYERANKRRRKKGPVLSHYNFVRGEKEKMYSKNMHNKVYGSFEGKRRSQNRYLKRTYDLTPEQYVKMFEETEFKCAMKCGTIVEPYNPRSHVDHDHVTGQIRGILCQQCNIGLGHYEKVRERAEVYLRHLCRGPAQSNIEKQC